MKIELIDRPIYGHKHSGKVTHITGYEQIDLYGIPILAIYGTTVDVDGQPVRPFALFSLEGAENNSITTTNNSSLARFLPDDIKNVKDLIGYPCKTESVRVGERYFLILCPDKDGKQKSLEKEPVELLPAYAIGMMHATEMRYRDARNDLQYVKGINEGIADRWQQLVDACPTIKEWDELTASKRTTQGKINLEVWRTMSEHEKEGRKNQLQRFDSLIRGLDNK